MKIKEFRLCWYSDIYNQVVVWWSQIIINLEILDYDWWIIKLNASQYSKNQSLFLEFVRREKNISFFSSIIKVDFLSEKWLNCWKNNPNSRVSILIDNRKYYSNTIWSYIYNDNFLSIESDFFNKWDHHLWVYNKYEEKYKDECINISWINEYSNDIIFVNRRKSLLSIFINLENDMDSILKEYLRNLKKGKKSIFYLDIFNAKLNEKVLWNIAKIISICKKGTYYIYNIEYSYLKKYNFEKDFYLYNYHFKPVYNNDQSKTYWN